MRSLLEAAGITGVDWWEGYILYARTGGRLQLDEDRRLKLVTFADVATQGDYIAAVQSLGGIIVTGDLWAVVAETMTDANAVQEILGGSIR